MPQSEEPHWGAQEPLCLPGTLVEGVLKGPAPSGGCPGLAISSSCLFAQNSGWRLEGGAQLPESLLPGFEFISTTVPELIWEYLISQAVLVPVPEIFTCPLVV